MNIGASLKVHNLVKFADQREDRTGGRRLYAAGCGRRQLCFVYEEIFGWRPSAMAAGDGRRRPMGLVASSAVGETTEGRARRGWSLMADFVSVLIKGARTQT